LNGVQYERSLLARYAAYPLKEGALSVDPIALKFSYYGDRTSRAYDEDDPFFGFFQQGLPRVGSAQSEKIQIAVSPLPENGKPDNFSGGVGQFEVEQTLDKKEVKLNTAVTLTLKVRGSGNGATLREPRVTWPPGLEVYDSKSRFKKDKLGRGEKIFEYVMIPHVTGDIELPALTLSFFDPLQHTYYTRSGGPTQIHVTGDPSVASSFTPQPPQVGNIAQDSKTQTSSQISAVRPLHLLEDESPHPGMIIWQPAWRLLYWACMFLFTLLLGIVLWDGLKKRTTLRTTQLPRWKALVSISRKGEALSRDELLRAYETLSQLILESCGEKADLDPRSLSRKDLSEILIQRGVSPKLWDQVEKILEYADCVQYATQEKDSFEKARSQLQHSVQEGQELSRQLRKS
jgi:hypothetical protein